MTVEKKTSVWVNALKFTLFMAVGLGIMYFVYQNQEQAYQLECQYKIQYDCDGKCTAPRLIDKIIQDFSESKFIWLFLVALAFMSSNLSRSFRWVLLLNQLDSQQGKSIRWYNAFFATMIGYLINLALPRAGELAKPATLSRYEGVPLDKSIGTIVTDRIMDILMLFLIMSLTFLFQFQAIYDFLSGQINPSITCRVAQPIVEKSAISLASIMVILFVLGLLVTLTGFVFRKKILASALGMKIRTIALNFWGGMKTIFSLKKSDLLWFILHTLNIWLMYFLMTYLCFFAFGPTSALGMNAALLVFVLGSLGVLVPSPGGMGTYQLATTAALVIYGIDKSDAFSFSNILFFTINIFCNIFFGLLAYMLLPILNKKSK